MHRKKPIKKSVSPPTSFPKPSNDGAPVLTFTVLGEDDHARVSEAAPGGGVAAAQVLHYKALRDGGAQVVGL